MNYASHYREVIYKMINDELDADFYFGNWKGSTVKKFDFEKLSNFKKEFKTIEFKKMIWYRGNIRLLFKNYDHLILEGEPRILSNWVILLFSLFTKKKISFWSHGWYGRESKFKVIFKKLYFIKAHKIFLYGNYAKKLMINEGFDPNKLITIYNSLDYDSQLKVRKKLTNTDIYKKHFKNSYPVIVFIGRAQRNKNLEQILDAMILLREKKVNYNFVLIGKEESGYDFKSEISIRGLEKNVWLYGPCYEEDILGELIFNSNVCVSPGNIGLTVIHSLVYGTPVITHNNFPYQYPEFEAIKDGFNGAFFEKDNIEDLSMKIEEVTNARFPKEQCYEVVDKIWNPHYQIEIFKKEFL